MPKPTVLLVDDEERALFGLGHVLRAEGYSLRFAGGPEDALRLLDAERVLAIVSDQLMPGMTGLELLARVRDRHPGVARLMLTGCVDPALAAEGRRSGIVHAFLQKPCDREAVRAAVRAAVALTLEVETIFHRAGAAKREGGG